MPKEPGQILPTKASSENNDSERIEPLISLICYHLRPHKSARTMLHNLINETWRPYEDLDFRDIERMIIKPIQRKSPKKTSFMIDLIFQHGDALIQALPESAEGENPRRLPTLFYNALLQKNVGIDLGMDPIDQKKAALHDLFGVRPAQVTATQNQKIEGDYFGYRRSTTRGTIIRFSLSIQDIGAGIYYFKNHFRSRDDDWEVTGTGFFTDGNLYLVGNASSKQGSVGRGLRCFALRPESRGREFVSGIVLTTESFSRPIGARVVLVPTLSHRDINQEPPKLDHVLAHADAKRHWITDDIDVATLDRAISVSGDERPSDTIVRCIRNGTVSTIRFDGCDGLSIGFPTGDEEYLLQALEAAGANPTLLYLRAIAGAEGRMKQGRS